MPDITDIKPAGIIIKANIGYDELKKIFMALKNCELLLDLKDPEQAECNKYINNEFFPWVKSTVEMIENDFRSER